MYDQDLQNFFFENEVRIGRDHYSSHPVYYLSVFDAFERYFLSFRDIKEHVSFVLESETMDREFLSWNLSSENSVFTILSFHRFFELFIKDQLRKINPLLAVKFPQKENEIVGYIDGKANAEKINTIEFSECIKRLKQSFKHYKNRAEYENHLKPFEFIINQESQKTLGILSEWRNKIMHNGSTLINVFALDYLVSQRIIPMIVKIITVQVNSIGFEIPYFFKTHSGLNIIDEILKIKFDFRDFTDQTKKSSFNRSILKLCHLKEIGRASYNHNAFLRENSSYYEIRYSDPLGRSERFAMSEKLAKYFESIKECFCCGSNSLVTYRREFKDEIIFKKTFINNWARCYHCGYEIDEELGDPHKFGFSSKIIFTSKSSKMV